MRDANGQVAITATSVSELTAACGIYLREWCNLTIGISFDFFSCYEFAISFPDFVLIFSGLIL
jgi:hypothetical protein